MYLDLNFEFEFKVISLSILSQMLDDRKWGKGRNRGKNFKFYQPSLDVVRSLPRGG
jgi:hypothetical protein